MIRFFRSVLVLLCFLIFGVGSFLLAFFIFPILNLLKTKKETYALIIHYGWRFFTRLLEILKIIKVNYNFDTNISGKIIVASHPSFIDIIILIGMFKKSTCFAKKEVLNNPLLGNIAKHIYITNDMQLETMKKLTTEYLQKGFNIIIFPTGTRTNNEDIPKIHKGAALISLTSMCEILPLKIQTSYPFLTKNHSITDASDKIVNFNITKMDVIDPNDYIMYPSPIARKRISNVIKNAIALPKSKIDCY